MCERAEVGFLEAVDVGEEGGVSVEAAETWNSGTREGVGVRAA